MTRPMLRKLSLGDNFFAIGLETYRFEDEGHLPWGSYIKQSGREWAILLGAWELRWWTYDK